MILTHLVMFSFLNGAGTAASTNIIEEPDLYPRSDREVAPLLGKMSVSETIYPKLSQDPDRLWKK